MSDLGVSAITPDRLQNLRGAIDRAWLLDGCVAELGVFKGGSARLIANMWPEKTLHLFDTFTGLPSDEDTTRDPDGYVRKGMFCASEEEVRAFLPENVEFHTGLFPVTTRGLDDLSFCFVHVDCDLYQSAKDAIEWFWPRMVQGGIMYFDDYGCKFTGVTEAVDAVFPTIEKQHDQYGNQIGCLVVKP